MISIFSYGKTKDAFGWPEETDEAVSNSNNGGNQQLNTMSNDQETQQTNIAPLTKVEK